MASPLRPPGIARLLPLAEPVATGGMAGVRGDLLAGLTVAAMLVPQGLAYATLAGMPAVTGLYAATLPLVVYALLGTSRHLGFGPTATASIVAAASVASLGEGDPTRIVALTALLAILAGLVNLAAGLLRLGFVVSFLSRPVLLGYTAGVALTIIASQLGKLFGIPVEGNLFFDRIASFVENLDQISWATTALGLSSFAALELLRRFRPRWPAALLVVTVATVVVTLFDLEAHGVAVTGDVPSGLPSLGLPDVGWADVRRLLPGVVAVALVTYVDSIAAAKRIALGKGYDVDPNRELIGVGGGNIAAGLVGAFPVDGSFSRTAVNAQAGGRSQLSGIVTALAVVATLVFLTPLFTNLPDAALAAVVVSAVYRMVALLEIGGLARKNFEEVGPAMLAMVGTLVFGVLPGILIAVVASLIVFVRRATNPNTAVLGWVPEEHTWRDVSRYPDAMQTPGLVAYRFDGPLFFGTADRFRDEVRDLTLHATPRPACIVLDGQAINYLDITGAATLTEVREQLAREGITLVLSSFKAPQRDRLAALGHDGLLADDVLYPTTEAAAAAYQLRTEGDGGADGADRADR